MLYRGGEAEGSDWRAPAEWTSCCGAPGENKVLPDAEESSAVTQRLFQVFQGHFTAVS